MGIKEDYISIATNIKSKSVSNSFLDYFSLLFICFLEISIIIPLIFFLLSHYFLLLSIWLPFVMAGVLTVSTWYGTIHVRKAALSASSFVS